MEFLTTEPDPLRDFSAYLFPVTQIQLYPTISGFILYPVGFVVYAIFSLMADTVGAALFFALSASLIVRGLSKLGLDTTAIFILLSSYPVLFTVSRGNNELLMLGLGLLVLSEIKAKRKPHIILAYLSCLTLFEPVPGILFWPENSWVARLRLIMRVVTVSILGILSVGLLVPPHDPEAYVRSLLSFGSGHSTNPYPGSSLFSTSLQSAIRVSYFLFHKTPPNYEMFSVVNRLIFLCGCLALAYFGLSSKYQLVDRMILTSSSWLVCYSASFEYRIVWLLVPLSLIFLDTDEKLARLRMLQAILIGFVCSPMTFIWWPEAGGHHIGSLIKPVLLVVLIVATAVKTQRRTTA